MGFLSGLSTGDCELARRDMTFSDGGRSTGEDDAVFMAMDRSSEVSGSTESGGVLGILIGGLDEKGSRLVGCTEA